MTDKRIEELREWEQETGLTLPMNPEDIIVFEEENMIIDLESGEILLDLENEGIIVG
jgi:hypothetical protein